MSTKVGDVLLFCDGQIVGEGLERLRLILYPVLQWRGLEKFSKPSEMYRKLESLDKYSSSEKALQMFLFAVKAIGGSKRGKICVKEAKKILGSEFTFRDLEFSKESKRFRFFFWLLKIERRLPKECKERMMTHFANSLGVNYRTFEESVPRLFIELHQKKQVHEDDVTKLKDALETCKTHLLKATPEHDAVLKCISYLTRFQDGEESEPFTSADEESEAPSVVMSNGRKRVRKQRITKKRPKGHGVSSSVPHYSVNDNNDGDLDSPAPKDTETSCESDVHNKVAKGITFRVELSKDFGTPVSKSLPGEAAVRAQFDLEESGESRSELTGSKYFIPPRKSSLSSLGLPATGPAEIDPEATLLQGTNFGSINDDEDEEPNLSPSPPRPSSSPRHILPQSSPERNSLPPIPPGQALPQVPPELNPTGLKNWLALKKNRKIVVFIFSILVVAVVWGIGGAVSFKYVWSPLHHVSSSHDVQHREGNVPILAEIDSFFVKGFYVEQEVDSDDSSHTVSVYLPNSACDDLPTITRAQEYNETAPPSTIPTYMLQHSLVSLRASASTPNSENNPVFFYILRTVESSIKFDPSRKDSRYRISVGKNSDPKPTNITVSIHESDYYSFRFSVPSAVSLTYTLSVSVHQIDIDALNSSLIGTINADSDDGTTGKSLNFGTGKYCLLADIKESSITRTNNYTSLEAHMQPRVNAGVGITVSLVFLFPLVVLLVEGLVLFLDKNKLVHFYNKHDRGYSTI